MKKRIVLLFTICILYSVFVGCTNSTKIIASPSRQIIDLADTTVLYLKKDLKNPSSVHINGILVSEMANGTSSVLNPDNENEIIIENTYIYTVYIDCSSDNGIGGRTNTFFSAKYYVCGDSVKLIDAPYEISDIPKLNGTVYEISPNELESYSGKPE